MLQANIAADLGELGRLDEAEVALRRLQQEQPNAVQAPRGMAVIARKRGDRQTALVHARAALSIAPRNTMLQAELAADLTELGRLDEAEAILLALREQHPLAVQAPRGLATIARKRRDRPLALAFAKAAHALDVHNAALHADIANDLIELGRLDEAEAVILSLKAAHGEVAQVPRGLATIERRRGNRVKALAHARAASSLDPGNAAWRAEIAGDLIELGRLEEAEAILSPLDTSRDQLPQVSRGLAAIARKRSNRKAALAHGRAALAASPGNPVLYVETAGDLAELGKLDEAEALLLGLKARQPHAIQVPRGLALIARKRGDRVAALKHLRAAVAAEPGNAALHADIASDLCELGRLEEAEAVLHEAAERHGATVHLPLGLAAIARKRNDGEAALGHLAHALDLAPGRTDIVLQTAAELRELGRFDEAEARLHAWRHEQPWHIGVSIGLVNIARCRGDFDRAIGILREAIAIYPAQLQLRLELVQTLTVAAAWDEALSCAEALASDYPWHVPAADMVLSLLVKMGRVQHCRAFILSRSHDPAFEHWTSLAWVKLAKASYDLDQAERDANRALELADAPKKLLAATRMAAKVAMMRGQASRREAILLQARETLTARSMCHLLPTLENTLHDAIAAEMAAYPFAERRLIAAQALPLMERPAAIAEILRDEPEHLGSMMYLLSCLRHLGVWQGERGGGVALPTSHIPKSIVQFWDSPDVPSEIACSIAGWKSMNPGYSHALFDDASAYDFIRDEVGREIAEMFAGATVPAMRADIFRLAYLMAKGGIYSDADDACRVPLSSWVPAHGELVLLQEDIGTIGNNFIAATPGHPLIETALTDIARNIRERRGSNIWLQTGPAALTAAFCRLYLNEHSMSRRPAGIAIYDLWHLGQYLALHLPRQYKKTGGHWVAPRQRIPRPAMTRC